MSEQNRATATVGLWVLSAIVLSALFISAAAQGELTPGHMLLAFVILACAIGGTVFTMLWKGSEQQEKAKRQHIDSLLHDISDEELIELKRRLEDARFDDVTEVDPLDDSGEARLRQ
jgi:hypothetical protein